MCGDCLQHAVQSSEMTKSILNDAACFVLADHFHIVRVAANKIIFAKGHENTCMGIVLEGVTVAKMNGIDSRLTCT